MFGIVGGTYIEECSDPSYRAIYGSGFRAAIALSEFIKGVSFKTCVGESEIDEVLKICNYHNILPTITPTTATVIFSYLHPLKRPEIYPDLQGHETIAIDGVNAKNLLYYGMAEAIISVDAERVVYDPQNLMKFSATNSSTEHLALILNKKEALYFSDSNNDTDIEVVGRTLLQTENAEIVIIKNGSNGAWFFDHKGTSHIPVYKTSSVWPIGSGDVFSAVFAWQWMHLNKNARDAATLASKYTAHYCSTRSLPLLHKIPRYPALQPLKKQRIIYLAGPFFTQAERWLIEELKEALEGFGNKVFSPFHDVGLGSSLDIAQADLIGIEHCEAMLAVVSGLDSGTLFEIGYARAKKKRVVVFAENVKDEDMLMLKGSNCEITSDFSSAIYLVSW